MSAEGETLYLRLYAGRIAWFAMRGGYCQASGEVPTLEQAITLRAERGPAAVLADIMEPGIDRAALPREWVLAGPFEENTK